MPIIFLPFLHCQDYFEARERFRSSARELGTLDSQAIDARGPGDELLTIDVARIGDPNAARLVVVSSGLHGVEGFFGSAVQLQLLADQWPTSECALLLIHTLNPFGFAWLRRVNEDNIDPNRNCLLPGQEYAGSPPGYAELDSLLNPRCPPSRCDLFPVRAGWAIARKGMSALKRAVASGQYEFPHGLFFGGSGPCATLRILHEQLPDWIGNATRIVHLDFHTGLGRWATHKLLVEHPLHDDESNWLARHFGADRIEVCDDDGVAYPIRGGLGTWCRQRFSDRRYTFLGAEFGTYSPLKIIAGLRAENQAHHFCRPGDEATVRAKRRLKELFCPASTKWREGTVLAGVALVETVAGALA